MKPKPFCALNHFTVPVLIPSPFLDKQRRHCATAQPRLPSMFWGIFSGAGGAKPSHQPKLDDGYLVEEPDFVKGGRNRHRKASLTSVNRGAGHGAMRRMWK